MGNSRKMGTIYPQRIKAAIAGENTKKIQSGYTKKHIDKMEGDTWTDENGKGWEIKSGIIQSIPKFQDVRIPLFCPKCNKVMGKKPKDTDVFYKFGFCFDCLIDRDVEMIREGTFDQYQEKYVNSKKLGFYNDAKSEIEEYLVKLEKGYIEYPTESGKMERWEGEDLVKMKTFWESELKLINEELEKLEGVDIVNANIGECK